MDLQINLNLYSMFIEKGINTGRSKPPNIVAAKGIVAQVVT